MCGENGRTQDIHKCHGKFILTRERLYILIGGAVLLLFGMVYRFYPDFGNSFSFERDIDMKAKQLAKYQQLKEERDSLENNLSVLVEQLKMAEAGLLEGETPAIAAVDIQNTLNEIAGKNEIEIRSMQVMRPEGQKEGAYLAIPVQVSIEANARGLKNVLYGIKTSSKTLRVSDLKIRAVRQKRSDRIQATFTVTGYMKKI